MGLLKLMVVEEFEQRRKKDYDFYRGAVYNAATDSCVEMFCAVSMKQGDVLAKLQPNAFFMTKDASEVKTYGVRQLRVVEKTKIFPRGAKFNVVEEKVQEFVSPNVITVEEAKKSPNKKRVSVCGVVAWASEVRGQKRKVRELLLKEDHAQVKVMLWGPQAEKTRRTDQELTLVALEVAVDESKNVVLHSSPSTKIEMDRFTEEVIIATTDDGFPLELVLECGETIHLSRDFGVNLEQLPVRVQVERDISGTIVGMVEVNEVDV